MRTQAPVPIPCPASLQDAVLWTVLYSGTFDFPLSRSEVFHFLIASEDAASRSRTEVEDAIDELISAGVLETDGELIYAAGRGDSVSTRHRRLGFSAAAWTSARRYARLIWMLPYVRMVAVTGALAMNNVNDGDDIDFFIIAEGGRLWLTRGMVLVVVKLARRQGVVLCPNFMLSTRALRLEQRDLYTAHELAQMIPLYGATVADSFLARNAWYRDVLPNAPRRHDAVEDGLPAVLRLAKSVGQGILDLPLGTFIERWEQGRKMSKLSRAVPSHVREARYTPDMCKGHADGHGDRVMHQWISEVARWGARSGSRPDELTG